MGGTCMTTVQRVEKKILQRQEKARKCLLSEEDRINKVLDTILDMQDALNKVSHCIREILPLMEYLSTCEVKNDKEFGAVESIVTRLREFLTQTSIFFSSCSKSTVIKEGCGGSLSDLRVNIRNLRESIDDVEEKFLLRSGEEVQALIDQIDI